MNNYSSGLSAAAAVACMIAAVAPLSAQQNSSSVSNGNLRLYIAAFASGKEGGIYQAELKQDTGELQLIGLAHAANKPLFLALHPNHQYLFAACEMDQYTAAQAGAVAAYQIDSASGQLTMLNHRSSAGAVPCHLAIDRYGKHLLVANYRGGNAAVLTIDADGKLGQATAIVQHHGFSVHKQRQAGPHPHSINLDPANRFAFVSDAGTDQIVVYHFDTTSGTLAANDPPAFNSRPGAAPRHLVFHLNGKWVYAINELDSTISFLNYDADRGVLSSIQAVSTLPPKFAAENLTAEIAIHPSGKFLYGSNRGHDSIAIFAINETSGRLTPLGHRSTRGRTPCHFIIDPSGRFLISALQDSDRVVIYEIEAATGMLTAEKSTITIKQPICMALLPM